MSENRLEISPIRIGKKSNGVLILLTGIGGTLEGYEGKYECIAKKAHDELGMSVLIATTPKGSWSHLRENLDSVMAEMHKTMGSDCSCYLMGFSAGGNIALCHSYLYPEIKRVLVINPVLNINLHIIRKGILAFSGERMTVVIGDGDSSYPFLGMLPKTERLEAVSLSGVDHVFTGRTDDFINLPFHYLLTSQDEV